MAEQDRDDATPPGENRPPVFAIGVIPARLRSTRLPRKVLRTIAGQPLLAWVVRAAAEARVFDRLIVAADSEEVAGLCRDRGWEFRETAPDLPSGTDRVHAVARVLEQEGEPAMELQEPDCVFVNIQGDEPLLRPEHFQALLRPFARPDVEVSTLRTPCPDGEAGNPNVVKVVVDRHGRALYFSRAPIPWDRDGAGGVSHWKHLGIYAYRPRALARFAHLPAGELEIAERLEQLRMLEDGIPIQVEPVEFDTVGVDTEADLERAATFLARKAPAADSPRRFGPGQPASGSRPIRLRPGGRRTNSAASDTLMAGDHG